MPCDGVCKKSAWFQRHVALSPNNPAKLKRGFSRLFCVNVLRRPPRSSKPVEAEEFEDSGLADVSEAYAGWADWDIA